MRDYGKVYGTFWSSETTGSLSDDGKLLALYLMTCSHSTIAGVFRLPDGYAAEDLGWSSARVAKGFAELFANGFANRCETTKWVWVIKHLEWNQPDNPNQRKSARKIALSVPESCVWKQAFMRSSAEVLAIELPPDSNASGTVSEPLPEPLRNQEQKQDQEQKEKKPTSNEVGGARPPDEAPADRPPSLTLVSQQAPATKGPPDCPHREVLALWAEVLPHLPQHLPEQWRGTRADHLRARWRETATAKGWQSQDDGLRYLRKLFGYVGQSPFLTGRDHTPGRRPFVIELEWLVNPTNWAKVHEGKYHATEEHA